MASMKTQDAEGSVARAAGDRQAARERLLGAGLRLFAAQGFAKTSTRELAEAAGVNVAAISYYFGDKAGLYRAAFFEPLCGERAGWRDDAGDTLDEALLRFYRQLLEPLRQGDVARLCMKLRFREMLEPTGLWDEEVAQDIAPMHQALLHLLCRHFGCTEPDDELQRLAVCIAGLGVHVHVGRDIVDALAPRLNDTASAVDHWVIRLSMYARAMVDAEARRRAGGRSAGVGCA